MNLAVVNIKRNEVATSTNESLANRLWDLLVQGEMNEGENVKKQFIAIENVIKKNKKHDR
ncbi:MULTISPECIES: hypothetical protein [Bacillus cereus group]|uniref:hypothetical protein n=1 Tax=Bacillus cereus group TaxID=86661 RepID=UPI0021137447|nr:hypothetical protein [Bacillus thuringiensis]MCQ6337544.1 hypothetical protein [Bacillus cereus]MDO6633482.1 hypothetical protein [Bacillus thuringiensis]MDO6662774.1 hypothetical protein [Bacillus thuringiensis]MDO6703646.1 hypothetical protein [Bacillus thuringiensis]